VWTTTGCPGTGPECLRDEDCDPGELCNLETGACEAQAACGGDDDCPPGWICHMQDGICVPESRGEGRLAFTPSPAETAGTVVVDAFHETLGLAYVSIDVDGPSGEVASTWVGCVDDSPPVYQWQWTSVPPVEGTYRVTFTAEPFDTVYAIGYFNALETPPEPGPDAPAEGLDAAPDDPLPESVDGTTDGADLPGSTGGCGCRIVL
jgi:hypothetical protein